MCRKCQMSTSMNNECEIAFNIPTNSFTFSKQLIKCVVHAPHNSIRVYKNNATNAKINANA